MELWLAFCLEEASRVEDSTFTENASAESITPVSSACTDKTNETEKSRFCLAIRLFIVTLRWNRGRNPDDDNKHSLLFRVQPKASETYWNNKSQNNM